MHSTDTEATTEMLRPDDAPSQTSPAPPRIVPQHARGSSGHPQAFLAHAPATLAPAPALGVADRPATPAPAPGYLLCEQCRAPVDREQRYCVQCGTRQAHAANPAIGYFAAAASARRSARRASGSAGAGRGPLLALGLIVLPLAVAVGVLVGRGSSNDNAALLTALRDQKPIVVNAAPAGTAAPAAATPAATSDVPTGSTLGSGFVVKLETLPTSGTTTASVTSADSAAAAKGATELGLIDPARTTTTPNQGATHYVIYSGFYTSRSAASQALGKLRSRFPGAAVIAVAPVGAGASAASSAVTNPKSVPHTAAQVGARPTATALTQGAAIAKQDQTKTGKSYVQGVTHLPPVITIPGNPSAAANGAPSSTSAAGRP